MKRINSLRKLSILLATSLTLTQCRTVDLNAISPTNEAPFQLTAVSSITSTSTLSTKPAETASIDNQTGCVLPPIQVSDLNIRYFYWSENSQSIIFKEKNGEIWHSYNTISGQTNPITPEFTPTPTSDYENFNINDYKEVFISPNHEIILFTRGTLEKHDVYYKYINKNQEYYLGVIRGYIKKVDWFNNEKNALLAMDWQAPVYPEAPIYMVDFSKNELVIEIPKMSNFSNIEYLGLTPDETRLMFVSYGNEQNDVTVKLWNISTNEITSTPIFNPLSFQWVGENELISVSQNPDKFSFVSVLLYNIDTSKTDYLADAKFSIDPFIRNAIISPDGTSLAYIENKTDNLYWTVCKP